jgi:hemerythrin-like metal-binding protein
MAIAEWKEAYRVGIETVDRQHEGIFELVNELGRACTDGADRWTVEALVDRLVRFGAAHFETERALLAPRGGASFASHMTEHKMISNWLEWLQFQIREDVLESPERYLDVLRLWVEIHVVETDGPAFRAT